MPSSLATRTSGRCVLRLVREVATMSPPSGSDHLYNAIAYDAARCHCFERSRHVVLLNKGIG